MKKKHTQVSQTPAEINGILADIIYGTYLMKMKYTHAKIKDLLSKITQGEWQWGMSVFEEKQGGNNEWGRRFRHQNDDNDDDDATGGDTVLAALNYGDWIEGDGGVVGQSIPYGYETDGSRFDISNADALFITAARPIVEQLLADHEKMWELLRDCADTLGYWDERLGFNCVTAKVVKCECGADCQVSSNITNKMCLACLKGRIAEILKEVTDENR